MSHVRPELGAYQVVRKFFFHGWTHNATPGSRARITDTVRNGYVFCLDPEAIIDRATLPSGMVIKGLQPDGSTLQQPGAWRVNVTKPATALIGLFAGIATNLPAEGLVAADYANGYWIDLVVNADAVMAWTHSTQTFGTTILGPADGDWGLTTISPGTNGASLYQVCARPLNTVDTGTTAALAPVQLIPRV